EPGMGITYERVSDLLATLGDIPLDRIRLRPRPGTATEQDVITSKDRFDRICELVDGILVEKPMGYYESRIAVLILYYMEAFLAKHDRGIVLTADGLLRAVPGRVRAPDVSFFSWDHFPDRLLPPGQILDMAPDLAIEVISPSNTKDEMAR